MTLIVNIIRVLVGLLFIFSGLVKANDPLGLSYKMQEFFELWKMQQFNDYTLWLSILMIAFEIIAGFAVLLGWKMRVFSWLLLLLTLFFTFLTAYAHFSGKFKNCGCFGDCIPISTKTSFLKDLALLVFVMMIFLFREKIRPLFGPMLNGVLMLAITIASFGMQWYTLRYLPFVDCLPYKKGKDIEEQMQMPSNAVPDVFDIKFVYEKQGKLHEFALSELPADIASYKFVEQKKKLVKKGKNNEPPIKGFSLKGNTGVDSTDIILDQSLTLLLFAEDFRNYEEWRDGFANIYKPATGINISVYLITTRPAEAAEKLKGSEFAGIQVFSLDYTAMRTAARANPTLYLLEKGVIKGKWSFKDMHEVLGELKTISVNAPAIKPQTDTTRQ